MATSFPIAKPLATPSRAGIGGPKSAAGKARSAANAVKHGLSSANPVILEYETVEAWEAFRDAFAADLHPQGPVEEELARELALIQWRRRRLPAYEARCADRRLQTAIASLEYYAERESQQELEERALVVLNEALLPNTEDPTRLLRYEAHLDRKFNSTLRHLERLQQSRKRETEAEICITNSAPRLPVPATPVPPVASVPLIPLAPSVASVPSVPLVPLVPSVLPVASVPSPPLPNCPAAESYKTNSPAPRPMAQQGPPPPQPAPGTSGWGFALQEGRKPYRRSVEPFLPASLPANNQSDQTNCTSAANPMLAQPTPCPVSNSAHPPDTAAEPPEPRSFSHTHTTHREPWPPSCV